MLPAWHQRFPMSGHVGESETAKKITTIGNFQVYIRIISTILLNYYLLCMACKYNITSLWFDK